MFTGVVNGFGVVQGIQHRHESIRLTIKCHKKQLERYEIGDSMAVNGVCLTATVIGADFFSADVMPATFRASNLKDLKVQEKVNLERALGMQQRFEGHLVAGHVDDVIQLMRRQQEQNAVILTFNLPKDLGGQIIPQGSVALDGTSLTVISVTKTTFTIGLIPHSQTTTVLGLKHVGANINLETDLLGKYIVARQQEEPSLNHHFLTNNGFN